MSNLLEQFQKSQGLLGAINAITDRRAFVTLFSTFALVGLLAAAFAAGVASLAFNGHFELGKLIGAIGLLLSCVLAPIGVSATGFLLNDSVRGRPQKTIAQAMLFSVASLHRIVGVLLVVAAIALLAVLAAFIAIFLCKIPALGPVLYAFVFPICALILGTLLYAGFFIVSLHGPAIWEGHPVLRTVGTLAAIFRQRLFAVAVQMILLTLLVALVGTLVMACISAGITLTGAISLPVLGQGLDAITPAAIFGGMMGGHGAGAAYLTAATFGLTLLAGLAITLPLLVAISGNCIIFAGVTENLSTAQIDQQLQNALEAARVKAEQTRRQLDEACAQLSAPAATVVHCPHCGVRAAADDAYCGSCGQRIV